MYEAFEKVVILNDEPLTNIVNIDTQGFFTVIFQKGDCIVGKLTALQTKAIVNKMISEFKDFNYCFTPCSESYCNQIREDFREAKESTEDEVKKNFKKKYKLGIFDIMAIGDTDAKDRFVKRFIPSVSFTLNYDCNSKADKDLKTKRGQVCHSYKSFNNVDYKKLHNNMIIHEDILSSWKGLVMACEDAKYGIIYKDYNLNNIINDINTNNSIQEN